MTYTQAKKNTIQAAKRDNYDYNLIVEDGSYTIKRTSQTEASELIIGYALSLWKNGVQTVKYFEKDI